MTEQSKSIQSAKDEVAKKHGYNDWAHALSCLLTYNVLDCYANEAILLYHASECEKKEANGLKWEKRFVQLKDWAEKELKEWGEITKLEGFVKEGAKARVWQLQEVLIKIKSLCTIAKSPSSHTEKETDAVEKPEDDESGYSDGFACNRKR